MTAGLEAVQRSNDIRETIAAGIGNRWPHPGIRRKMDNNIDICRHVPNESLVKNVADKELNPARRHFRHFICSAFFEWMNSCEVGTSSDG